MDDQRRNAAEAIRSALSDAHSLCEQLGLAPANATRQTRGYSVCCVWHGEKNPSLSVTIGPDGTVRVHCFSCGLSTDALGLVAKVHDLDIRSQFREVLIVSAGLAGLTDLVDALQRDTPYEPPARPAPREAPPAVEIDYPPAEQVALVWSSTTPVTEDLAVGALLSERGIDPNEVARLDLARALAQHATLPRWAGYQGLSWVRTGHRLLLPVYDSDGRMRSLRAWRVVEGDSPKRLPPGGHKAAGLVLANAPALDWLRHSEDLPYAPPPMELTVVEGEPDFLSRATLNAGGESSVLQETIIGVLSGSWHPGFAQKVPHGSGVVLMTHRDRAGDKYAQEVAKTLREVEKSLPVAIIYRKDLKAHG